ncbi:exosortase family protein XrtF [Flavobacterium sp. TMP13]|uniref:exosortase family protein XrtF n=1 Tax=Flavobacterium sp. TMP13 TaxID=3425950 RepID=UPI003D76E42B
MKKYLQQYRPFLIFLGSFFLTYIILTFLYQCYLDGFDENTADDITTLVSKQSEWTLKLFGYEVSIAPVLNEWYVYYQNQTIVSIVEGCNAVSVFILFISFIVAFSGTFKNTAVFILAGTTFIYALNVFRIAMLTILLYEFPQYTHFLHGVLFPLIIYGMVFILWFVWITKYSKYAD